VGKYDGIEKNRKGRSTGNTRGKKYGRILGSNTRVGTLIVATIYLQLIQNRYMFRSFTVL